MSYIDKATVGGTTYDLHDSSLDANIASNANIWESGAIAAATGGNSASTQTIRTKGRLYIDFEDIHALTGYKLCAYGWSGGTYLGFFTGAEFKKTGSALTYYSDLVKSSDLKRLGADSIRIAARKSDDTTISASEGVKIVFKYNKTSFISEIQNSINHSESPFQHSIYDIRRCNFAGWYSGLQDDYTVFGENTTYSEVIEAFDALVTAHPDYVTKNALGTASGTDSQGNSYTIYEYVFTPKQKTSPYFTQTMPKMLLNGSIHGFEKGSTYGLYYFIKDVIENWTENSVLAAIRSQVQIRIIPVANPYGFDRNSYNNGNGVNINRNFDHPGEWVVITEPDTETNGLAAFDQPESAIIRDWLIANEDNILMYFDCHTNGKITTGYEEMNVCMTRNDSNDPYYDKIIGVFTNHIEEQTLRFTEMYQQLQPTSAEMLGTITTTAASDKGTASTYANTMRSIIAMTLEMFNELKDSSNNVILDLYSADSMKIDSEIIGNMIIQVLAEYAPY